MKRLELIGIGVMMAQSVIAQEVPEATEGFTMPIAADYKDYSADGSTGWSFNQNAGNSYGVGCLGIMHPGKDLNLLGKSYNQDRGYPIFPVATGKVAAIRASGWNRLAIEHNYKGERVISHYGHAELDPETCKAQAQAKGYGFDESFLSRGDLQIGDTVHPWDQIGCIWDHGVEGSAHLHLEIRKDNHPDKYNLDYFCENTSVSHVETYYENPLPFIASHGHYAKVMVGTPTFAWFPDNVMCQDANVWYDREISPNGKVSLREIAKKSNGYTTGQAFDLCVKKDVPAQCRAN